MAFIRLVTFVAVLMVWGSTCAQPQSSEKNDDRKKQALAHKTEVLLPDVWLRDRENREIRFPTFFEERIVIVNFVFTTCSTVCPVLSATLQALEKQLQGQLGKEIVLVSISVDPLNDTPEKLQAYAKKLNAGPHWYWLTGRAADVSQVLRAFGIPSGGRPEDHPPVILAGSPHNGKWLRWVGIPPIQSIVDALDVLY